MTVIKAIFSLTPLFHMASRFTFIKGYEVTSGYFFEEKNCFPRKKMCFCIYHIDD